MNDETFELYDLEVKTLRGNKEFVCSHVEGDTFYVEGENLVFLREMKFSLYSLAGLLPILPAKQRSTDKNDWMTTDTEIACTDPNCGAIFKITRKDKRAFKHSEVTKVKLTG